MAALKELSATEPVVPGNRFAGFAMDSGLFPRLFNVRLAALLIREMLQEL
jgi:hypothetical protein